MALPRGQGGASCPGRYSQRGATFTSFLIIGEYILRIILHGYIQYYNTYYITILHFSKGGAKELLCPERELRSLHHCMEATGCWIVNSVAIFSRFLFFIYLRTNKSTLYYSILRNEVDISSLCLS